MASECYKTSCWCAPIRCLFSCCSRPNPPPLQPITQVMVNTIHHQPTPSTSPLPQNRKVTWKATHDKITYQLSHSVINSDTKIDVNAQAT